MAPAEPRARIQRHGRRARWLHGLNAATMVVLLVTGLALGDWVPVAWVAQLGGHDVMGGVHQWLGLAFVGAAVVLAFAWHAPLRFLLSQLRDWHRGDGMWPVAYLRHALAPRREPAPPHAGYFDPLERFVLSVMLAGVVVAGVTGVYLYWLPSLPTWVFLIAIRAHVTAAWVVIVLFACHVVAGLGVLPTHRGLARTMFGDGTLPLETARRLWPRWVERHMAGAAQGGRSAGRREDQSFR